MPIQIVHLAGAFACLTAAAALHLLAGMTALMSLLLTGLSASTLIHWRYYASRRNADATLERQRKKKHEQQRLLTERVKMLENRLDELAHQLRHETEQRQKTLGEGMRGLETLMNRMEHQTLNDKTEHPALAEMHQALKTGRIDLHLQPVVALPQRHTKFYEGFTRLRRTDGQIIMPPDFLEAARQARLLPVIDTLLLLRCVEIVRRFTQNNRQIGVFCNISPATLEDNSVFPEFLAQIGNDSELTDAMIFEMSLTEFSERSETVRANMSRLGTRGFRFSIDKASSLTLDLPALQAAGIRFVKMEAQTLLKALASETQRPKTGLIRPIRAEEVCLIFRRHGMEIIIDKAEDEKSVIELMEYGVRYGQGHVFGLPRPIRESLLVDTMPPEALLRRVGQNG